MTRQNGHKLESSEVKCQFEYRLNYGVWCGVAGIKLPFAVGADCRCIVDHTRLHTPAAVNHFVWVNFVGVFLQLIVLIGEVHK